MMNVFVGTLVGKPLLLLLLLLFFLKIFLIKSHPNPEAWGRGFRVGEKDVLMDRQSILNLAPSSRRALIRSSFSANFI